MRHAVDTPTLTNCSFINNWAGTDGGGIRSSQDMILISCSFSHNQAGGNGGGLHLYAGYEHGLTDCVFIGNSAGNYGGGVFTVELSESNTRMTNSTFSGNIAGNDGGGFSSSHCYTTFTNCTFSGNSSAGGDGGGFCVFGNGGTPDFNNCIFWGNTAAGEGPQIAIKTSFATVGVNYSDVEGGQVDIYEAYPDTLIYGANNINSDPLFVDADGADDVAGTEDDDLHLLWDSPCINVGDDVSLTEDYDGVSVPQETNPAIGAYEYVGENPPLSANINASPTSGEVPLTVNFTGSATGGTPPYSYSWDFGDSASSTEQNPSRYRGHVDQPL